MNNEIGIAGWLYSQEILKDKTLTQLELPALCAAQGVSVVELCSKFFPSQETDYLNDLRAILADNGLSVYSIAVDMGNISGADASERRTDIDGLKQWFYLAAAIGSKAIRINSGHADDPEAMQRTIDAYDELAEVGSTAGVKLLIENHGGLSAYSDGLAEIIGGVDSEWFGTCPDTGNFYGDDWRAGIEVMAPRAYSCHLKLFHLEGQAPQKWTDRNGGERNCDLNESLGILKSSGYTGPFCLEHEAPVEGADKAERVKRSLDYARGLVKSV